MSDSSAVAEKGHDDSSKLKTFLSILRKFVGVADIASVRFSLPAQLLEPTPNLEYWNYLDRPETFASIGTSIDDLGRMLEVLRFWFTKDLKYIKGKPCKPYNSTLGEFFRAYWEVDNTTTPALSSKPTNGTVSTSNGSAKVCFLTEQTSHHPPVSAFYIDCPERGISARGFDQISAKFTGTSIRVGPGQHNLGIFVNLANRDNEEYQLTHPAAHLSGLLRGSLYISVADSCYITCRKTKIKVILQYLEDGWVSKAHSRVEGVIFRYDPDNDTKMKIKDVPSNDVLARINGCWREQIYYTLTSAATSGSGSSISSRSSSISSESNKPQLLIDLVPLTIVPKSVPPEEVQLSNESRKFWSGVTSSILSKQFSQATKLKQEIEERQRAKAAEREAKSEKWKPRFFTDAVTPLGRPDLTDDGRKALEKMFKGDFELEESQVTGA